MGKLTSRLEAASARLIKTVLVVVLLPPAIGLLLGILDHVRTSGSSGEGIREWMGLGFAAYVGIHLLLYRPVALFQASRRLFSVLAVWLFGGQVASVEKAGGGKGSKGGKGEGPEQASTLVAFSPYVVPLFTILVCLAGGVLIRGLDRIWIDWPLSLLIGMTLAFQWLMTADELQKQRSRWRLETYLLALTLIFMLTLLIASAGLAWAFPEFSFVEALAQGLAHAQAAYAALWQQLFL